MAKHSVPCTAQQCVTGKGQGRAEIRRAVLPCTLVLGSFRPEQEEPYLCQAVCVWGGGGYIQTEGHLFTSAS